MRALTGFDCPLCGATRATLALLHGHLQHALDMNALYVLLLPALGCLLVFVAARRRWPGWVTRPATLRIALALAVVWMVARNLPWAPFTYLSTTS